MLAEASVAGGASAQLDGDVLSSSQITVGADGLNTAEAHTEADSVSLIVGIGAGSTAAVTDQANVEAGAGASDSLTTTGPLLVDAEGKNTATSDSTMGSGAILVGAVGGSLSAIVAGAVRAELDGDVFGATSVDVLANGSNTATSSALAISVGLIG